MTAKTKAPTTSLIKCTPDITRTQAMIAARTASKMPMNHKGEAAGEQIKTVNAIINAEKTPLNTYILSMYIFIDAFIRFLL